MQTETPRATELADSTNHSQQQKNQQADQHGVCRFTIGGGEGRGGGGGGVYETEGAPASDRRVQNKRAGSCPSFPCLLDKTQFKISQRVQLAQDKT